MKIIKEKKIEGCLEGSNVKDFMFDNAITKEFIEYLGKLGKIIYTENIDKPFFRVIVRAKYTIKGSQGNTTIRIILPNNSKEELIEELKQYVGKY